jgi:hypothetical protein
MVTDDGYFRMPDEVARGGVQEAIRSGYKEVAVSNLLWQVAEAAGSLGRSDRIHFFVMLCGGGPKVETDDIEDVKFGTDNGNLSVVVYVKRGDAFGHWGDKPFTVTVNFAIESKHGG